jgi:serine/threonine-protein kinase
MTDEARVHELVNEILDSDCTPEEVCADSPDLLPAVRKRLQQMSLLQAEIDILFPMATDKGDADTFVAVNAAAELPNIPGYEVNGVIGRGGMGIVYQAYHLRLKRTVALKMLLGGVYAGVIERQRFLREAEAVAALRHPNVVQVYDVGDVDGRPYFTMELVEGGSLRAKIAGTPQPAAWAASLTATLAGAIHYAHQSGIVHRDLKPANILLAPNPKSEPRNPKQSRNTKEENPKPSSDLGNSGLVILSDFELGISDFTPKVTDFGLARRLEDEAGLTLSGLPMGTPSYMAPEQARGDKSAIGPATDVYALGAILYELLTGRPPFRADTATATLQQVMGEEPAPPTRLNSRIPRDLETICLKCLQKGPSERYVSAAALADDLRRFERGEPITARPPGALGRAAKWARRRPTVAALLATGLLMLAGITAAAVWYADDRAQRRAEAQSRDGETNAALRQADLHLKDLRDRVDDPLKVRELLSDIEKWQGLVEQAREDLHRAKSASVGNEALLTQETRARLQAVEVAVDRQQAAYDLARELDDIAVGAFASFDVSQSHQRKAVADYERFFSKHGLDVREPNTAQIASAIRSSPIRFALIAALDNWALLAGIIKWNEHRLSLSPDGALENGGLTGITKDPQLARLLELARETDRDPWRDRFRDPVVWGDRAALTGLADAVDVRRQSPTVLAALGWLLAANDADPTALFERALLAHPRDFWLLRHALSRVRDPGARIGLALAALAVRPREGAVYCSLAWCLGERGDWREALAAANRVIELNADYSDGYTLRGLALMEKKDMREALADFQKAIELAPDGAWPRYNLGRALHQLGRYAEAEQAYLSAIQVQPSSYGSYLFLAQLLATCPNDKVRDGKRAVEYATTACQRSRWKDPTCLDTLAAAYAEVGQFEEAVLYQTRALDDPALKGDSRKAAEKRLELYTQKKAFREKGP